METASDHNVSSNYTIFSMDSLTPTCEAFGIGVFEDRDKTSTPSTNYLTRDSLKLAGMVLEVQLREIIQTLNISILKDPKQLEAPDGATITLAHVQNALRAMGLTPPTAKKGTGVITLKPTLELPESKKKKMINLKKLSNTQLGSTCDLSNGLMNLNWLGIEGTQVYSYKGVASAPPVSLEALSIQPRANCTDKELVEWVNDIGSSCEALSSAHKVAGLFRSLWSSVNPICLEECANLSVTILGVNFAPALITLSNRNSTNNAIIQDILIMWMGDLLTHYSVMEGTDPSVTASRRALVSACSVGATYAILEGIRTCIKNEGLAADELISKCIPPLHFILMHPFTGGCLQKSSSVVASGVLRKLAATVLREVHEQWRNRTLSTSVSTGAAEVSILCRISQPFQKQIEEGGSVGSLLGAVWGLHSCGPDIFLSTIAPYIQQLHDLSNTEDCSEEVEEDALDLEAKALLRQVMLETTASSLRALSTQQKCVISRVINKQTDTHEGGQSVMGDNMDIESYMYYVLGSNLDYYVQGSFNV